MTFLPAKTMDDVIAIALRGAAAARSTGDAAVVTH
jgi:hypothetical protein